MRKGEELKAPRHASAAALCDDHVTIYNIIPNRRSELISFINRTFINIRLSIVLKRIKDFRLKRNIKHTELAILSRIIT